MQGGGELRELGCVVLLQQRIAEFDEGGFRVEAGVFGPGKEVAAGQGQRRPGGADPARQSGRQVHARGHLAQLGEAPVGEDERAQRAAGLDLGDESRIVLFGEEVLATDVEHLAARPEVVVELRVAGLPVHHRIDANAVEQGDRGPQRTFQVGGHVTEVDARRSGAGDRGSSDFQRRPVGQLLPVGIPSVAHGIGGARVPAGSDQSRAHDLAAEPGGDRESGDAALAPGGDEPRALVDPSQVHDLVVVRREVEGELDVDVVGLVGGAAQLDLDPLVPDFAGVHELAPGKPQRRRQVPRQDRVLRARIVVGEVDPETAVEESRFEPDLQLCALFRLQGVVADELGRHRGDAAAAGNGREGAERRVVGGLLARHAEGGAELEFADSRDVEEVLFAQHPGDAGLGVDDEVVVLAEGAVVVRADRRGEEHSVPHLHALLHEEAEGVVLDEVLAAEGLGQGVDDREPRRREVVPFGHEEFGEAAIVLRAPRGGGADRTRDVECRRRTVVEGRVLGVSRLHELAAAGGVRTEERRDVGRHALPQLDVVFEDALYIHDSLLLRVIN